MIAPKLLVDAGQHRPCMAAGRRSGSRRALTVLELLIVLASLTSVVSLVFPALLASRESGRDRQCTNRLKEIALALKVYEDYARTLPPGWTLESTKQSGYGWATAILPQLNEHALDSQIDRTGPLPAVAPQVRQTTPVIFLCPSDHGNEDFPLFAELGAPGANAQESTELLATLPRANYVGLFGVIEPDEVPSTSGTGVFVEGRGIRYNEITRGLSRVLLLGERTTRKLPTTWIGIMVRGEDAGGRIVGCAKDGPNLSASDECEFDSRHFGHVNLAWVDGHVGSIEDGIDSIVYQSFAKRY